MPNRLLVVTIRKVGFFETFHRHDSAKTQLIFMKLRVLYWIGYRNVYTQFVFGLVERLDELVMTLNSQLRALESRYRAAVKSHIKGNFNSDQRRSMHWKWDSNGPYIMQLYWDFFLICIRLKKSEKKVSLDMKGPSLVPKMLFMLCL